MRRSNPVGLIFWHTWKRILQSSLLYHRSRIIILYSIQFLRILVVSFVYIIFILNGQSSPIRCLYFRQTVSSDFIPFGCFARISIVEKIFPGKRIIFQRRIASSSESIHIPIISHDSYPCFPGCSRIKNRHVTQIYLIFSTVVARYNDATVKIDHKFARMLTKRKVKDVCWRFNIRRSGNKRQAGFIIFIRRIFIRICTIVLQHFIAVELMLVQHIEEAIGIFVMRWPCITWYGN